jgi:endoglucanase
MAVVIDVTFAKGPGISGWEAVPLGKGPTIGWGANLHPFLHGRLKEIATKLDMTVGPEYVPGESGTDAFAIQIAREGIPTALIGIPLRYMHTPVEIVSIKDVQRAGRLLAEFISGLEPDFASKIRWDNDDARE